jgi:hypothetical protein
MRLYIDAIFPHDYNTYILWECAIHIRVKYTIHTVTNDHLYCKSWFLLIDRKLIFFYYDRV